MTCSSLCYVTMNWRLYTTDQCLGKGAENLNDRPIAFLQQSKKLWGWVFSSIWERALRLKLWSFFTACRSSSLITLRNSFQSLLTSPHWKEKIKWQFSFFRVPRISISYRSRYFKHEKFVSFWRTETEIWALISVKVKKVVTFCQLQVFSTVIYMNKHYRYW